MLTAGNPATAGLGLVLLHGRGAGPEGIVDLARMLGREDVAVAAPAAPGNSWWPTSFLAPAAQMEPWVGRGLDAADAAIAHLTEGGLDRSAVAVAGFSQGGCLALEYGARRGAGLRAVLGLSAGLVGTSDEGAPSPELYGHAGKAFGYDTDLSGVRAVVSTHTQDPHIPLARARESVRVLEGLGAEVTSNFPEGAMHGVTEWDLAQMRRLLG